MGKSKKDTKDTKDIKDIKIIEEIDTVVEPVVETPTNQLSDTDSEFNSDSDYEDQDDEFEEIDVTDNPLYQVLSAFFETEEGENICDILKDLSETVKEK